MESFRTADGRTLSYRREGSGLVLVCHPGGPGFSSRYFDDLAGLGADFTLVLLNPRGTEGSDRPADPRAYATEDYVADVEELRGHLGLERILLLGHSHGGVVAALEDEQEGRFESDEELADLAMREFPLYFARFGDAERSYLELLRGEVPVADALLLFNNEIFTSFDLRPELPKIVAPTLVITGADDFITGPACAADFAAIPGARTVIIPDCGHFIFVEARDRFRDEVTQHLSA